MSRGFVKEDDQEEIPLVPKRAWLPDGVPNFVTQAGMDQLEEEKRKLTDEKNHLTGVTESDKRIELNFINAKLQLLNNRIAEARIVNLSEQPKHEIRFGATITLKAAESDLIQTFQIVGVDEADIAKGRISFISPVAKSLINKKKGDRIALKRAGEDIIFEIAEIIYG
jgi:transcription elongation factor GreB